MRFDIDFASTSQDPSPTGLTQGWSCQRRHERRPLLRSGGGLADGRRHPDQRRRGQAWHAVLRRIEDDAPAVFMYALTYMYAVNRRFTNVRIRPESAWLGLREWTVGPPGRATPRGY